MKKNLFSGLTGACCMLLIAGIAFAPMTQAQVTEEAPPVVTDHHNVDMLMGELTADINLTEEQDARIRAMLQEELDRVPEGQTWHWSVEHQEFNLRIEEALDEHQREEFRTWVAAREQPQYPAPPDDPEDQ